MGLSDEPHSEMEKEGLTVLVSKLSSQWLLSYLQMIHNQQDLVESQQVWEQSGNQAPLTKAQQEVESQILQHGQAKILSPNKRKSHSTCVLLRVNMLFEKQELAGKSSPSIITSGVPKRMLLMCIWNGRYQRQSLI